MKKAVIRYRVKFALATLGVGACVVLFNRYLPAGIQPFAWGVAAGLLFMLAIIVIGWLVKGASSADPVEVRRNMPARSRRMKIAAGMVFPAAYGLWLIARFGLPSDMSDVFGGTAVGALLTVAIMIGPAFWMRSKPNPLLAKRKAPLEETSHMMIVPPNDGADLHRYGKVP